LVSIDFVEAK
jgi:hypothetical protein